MLRHGVYIPIFGDEYYQKSGFENVEFFRSTGLFDEILVIGDHENVWNDVYTMRIEGPPNLPLYFQAAVWHFHGRNVDRFFYAAADDRYNVPTLMLMKGASEVYDLVTTGICYRDDAVNLNHNQNRRSCQERRDFSSLEHSDTCWYNVQMLVDYETSPMDGDRFLPRFQGRAFEQGKEITFTCVPGGCVYVSHPLQLSKNQHRLSWTHGMRWGRTHFDMELGQNA